MSSPTTEVGPGWWAFVAFFFLAVGLWLLMRSMFTRLRRMRLAEADRQAQERGRRAEREVSGALGDRPVEGERRRREVGDEGEDGEGVEDLVEPEPPR